MALQTISDVGGCDGLTLAFFGDFFDAVVVVPAAGGDDAVGAATSDMSHKQINIIYNWQKLAKSLKNMGKIEYIAKPDRPQNCLMYIYMYDRWRN